MSLRGHHLSFCSPQIQSPLLFPSLQLCYLLTTAYYISHRTISLPLSLSSQPLSAFALLYSQESSLFSDALAFGYKNLSLSKALSAFHPATAPTARDTVFGERRWRTQTWFPPLVHSPARYPGFVAPHSTTRYSYLLDVISSYDFV